MTKRKLNTKDGVMLCCPRCLNAVGLIVCSEFISEEVSETWVECECGFKPSTVSPVLDIFDTLDGEKVGMAICFWNGAVRL